MAQTALRQSLLVWGWMASLLLGGTAIAQPVTTGSLAVPGEIDEYRFVLDRPTTLHFDSQSNLDALQWSLEGPFGPIVTGKRFYDDSVAGSILPLGPGEHRIRVQATDDTTSPYAFRLTPLPTGANLPVGLATPGALAPGNGAAFRSFTPAVGDRFRIEIAGKTPLRSHA